MKIAIASGKGGTGKSTVSTNLAYILSKKYNGVALIDCDVEEPNCHIFMKPDLHYCESVYVPVPSVDNNKCISCGKCNEVCQFNALAFIKNKVFVFDELCHGCGSCELMCPANAISETGRKIGIIEAGKSSRLNFVHGKSRIGEAMSPPLIRAVKKYSDIKNFKFCILDCPPGTSCPVINAIDGVDFVILVTEPTPFGLNDLKLAVNVVQKMKLPFGIVVNRSSDNDKIIEDWARKDNVNILTKIPDDRDVAECYSAGELVLKKLPDFGKYFQPLVEIIRSSK